MRLVLRRTAERRAQTYRIAVDNERRRGPHALARRGRHWWLLSLRRGRGGCRRPRVIVGSTVERRRPAGVNGFHHRGLRRGRRLALILL